RRKFSAGFDCRQPKTPSASCVEEACLVCAKGRPQPRTRDFHPLGLSRPRLRVLLRVSKGVTTVFLRRPSPKAPQPSDRTHGLVHHEVVGTTSEVLLVRASVEHGQAPLDASGSTGTALAGG